MECKDVPPAVNMKCIIFTLILALGYWYLPSRNKWVLLSLLYFPYLAMAYYDYYYVCKRNLGPTYLALFYSWAKPKESEQIVIYDHWCPKWKKRVLIVDLIVLVVLLLLIKPFMNWKPT